MANDHPKQTGFTESPECFLFSALISGNGAPIHPACQGKDLELSLPPLILFDSTSDS